MKLTVAALLLATSTAHKLGETDQFPEDVPEQHRELWGGGGGGCCYQPWGGFHGKGGCSTSSWCNHSGPNCHTCSGCFCPPGKTVSECAAHCGHHHGHGHGHPGHHQGGDFEFLEKLSAKYVKANQIKECQNWEFEPCSIPTEKRCLALGGYVTEWYSFVGNPPPDTFGRLCCPQFKFDSEELESECRSIGCDPPIICQLDGTEGWGVAVEDEDADCGFETYCCDDPDFVPSP